MFQLVSVLCLVFLNSLHCQEVPGENIPFEIATPAEPSSTADPRDAFIQAISDTQNVIEEEIKPFANFDREPQAPPPTFPPPQEPRYPDYQDLSNTPNIFDPPSRDININRLNVDEFGNPLGDVLDIGETKYELGVGGDPEELRCPRNWERFGDHCYKFTRSPPRKWDYAREICQQFKYDDSGTADLASIDTFEEHRFITEYLNKHDPQHRRWYISTRQENKDQWVNQGDGTQMLNLQEYFLDSNEWGELELADYKKDHLVYAFSLKNRRWGFQPVFGHEEYLYICEAPIEEVSYFLNEERTAAYGQPLGDPRYIQMGPHFVRQPNHTVFDLSRRQIINDVSLLCIAQGWPTPTYKWYKEVYINDTLQEVKVDPLLDSRLTVSGGQLIIHRPDQTKDKGTYFCAAENIFGKIRSKSVSLAFGFIGEFILRRSNEIGNENWGKAIKCDAPHHYPDVRYYWAREYFPNFVEEDRRIMVSHDGYIYFSALENIDKGNYSCNVQSAVSNIGRNGPFFTIDVQPHPNHQQLRFPQNFPKSFPEAPVAGEEVRLECIAFGYPVPHYNWTRKNAALPRGSYITNYNRVLIIPHVRVEDQGEYECGAKNDNVHISATVTLSIQSRPVFTIPIGDRFFDENDEVIWTCEAFGIPDVQYSWLRNGKPLTKDILGPEDRDRYIIKDNVLKIKQVSKDRDEGMYQCKASNDLDTRYSSGQLKVLMIPPTFNKHPLDQKTYAAETGNVTLSCKPEAAPRANITWYHEGNRIGSGGKRIIYPSGSLFLSSLTGAESGQYDCEATNKYGTDRSSGQLIVKKGPSFRGPSATKPTRRIIANKGERVELRCAAEADDILDRAYYWRLNDFMIQFVEDYEEERLLELKNAGGSRVNSEIDQLAFKPLDSHTEIFSSSLYNSRNLKNKGTGDFQKFRRGIRDGYMNIDNITIAEAGVYECAVETVVGTIKATSEVIVHSPPGPPGGITAVNMGNTSCTVSWTDGAFYGLRIERYRIEGHTDHNDTWSVLADQVEGQDIDYQGKRTRIDGRRQFKLIDKLTPWAAYSFRVAAYNDLGLGEWSEPSPQYNTKPGRPNRNVTNIRTGEGGRTGDMIVMWDPLSREYQNAPGIYYKVYYKRVGEISFKEVKSLRALGNINSHTIRIEDSFYYTKYLVKVQVFNDKCIDTEGCEGPMSEAVEVLSAEDLPQVAPTTVGARPFNSTAIRVSWTPIPNVREKVRGKLIGHRIKYWRQDLNEVTESQYVLSRSTDPTALIIGLQPNTYYWVRVMAYNSAGPGPESERFLERTFKLRPQKPPTAVQVYGINPSTIKVTWRYVAPTVQEEPLTGYKIRVWESDKDISQANDTTVYIGTYSFKLEATITDLSPGKTYFLRVLAFSQGGEGKMSSPAWKFQMGDPDRLNKSPVLEKVSLFSAIIIPIILSKLL